MSNYNYNNNRSQKQSELLPQNSPSAQRHENKNTNKDSERKRHDSYGKERAPATQALSTTRKHKRFQITTNGDKNWITL
jgi:hypothetical protein